jgi:hypothetical protein
LQRPTTGRSWIAWAVQRLRPAIAAFGIAFVVVAPWLWRNWIAYGRPSLYVSTNRNVLMYKSMHAHSTRRPRPLSKMNQLIGRDQVDWYWLAGFEGRFPSNEAEAIAGRILAEEIERHPWRHLGQIGASVAGFAGFTRVYGNERAALLYWFREYVHRIPRLNSVGRVASGGGAPRLGLRAGRGNTWATRLHARVGQAYLRPGRAIAMPRRPVRVGFYLARALAMRRDDHATHLGVVLMLSVGYLGTVAMHAVVLTDYDRYASMFDFVMVLLSAVILHDVLSVRRRMASAEEDPRQGIAVADAGPASLAQGVIS